MKVVVSSISKFHAFSLAQELDKRGHLERLLVSYYNPRTNAKGYDIAADKLTTNVLPFVVDRLPWKVPALKFLRGHTSYPACQFYDRWARSKLRECDVFVGWSSFSLHTLRRARERYGSLTVLEHGSAHVVAQTELLKEEYARFGVEWSLTHPGVIAKEVREYDAADFISIPSDFVRRTFVEQGIPAEKLIQIPYGVDLSNFRPAGKDDSVFRVMHIGCSVRKGTVYLLKALEELALPHSELVLLGTIEAPLVQAITDFPGTIVHHTHVPHRELFQHYSRSSVYVLPSVEDGFGMVVSEAMACGVPVICSSHAGGEDVIRHGVDGFVVPPRDVEALKEGLLMLYEDEALRREMGERAIGGARRFTWDRYGEAMVDAYQARLAAHTPGDLP